MQLTITTEDLVAAPTAVQTWVLDRLWGATPAAEQPGKTPEPKAEEMAEPAVEKEPVEDASAKKLSVDDVIEKAVTLLKQKGEDVLAEVLKAVGVKRVKECPPEKLAELLAEISIHLD